MSLPLSPRRRPGERAWPALAVAALLLGAAGSGCASSSAARRPDPEPAEVVPGPGLYGVVIKRGLIDCFPEGAERPDKPGSVAYCETSAVLKVGPQLYLASDKPIPGEGASPVFAVGLESFGGRLGLTTEPSSWFAYPPFLAAKKAEDMTFDPQTGFAFLTTAFDRIEPDDPGTDAYNTLLAWPDGHPELVQVVAPSEREGVVSSAGLREPLALALADEKWPEGPPYFKVEALTALPGKRLLFGIREAGESYEKFDYSLDLVQARYDVVEGKVVIDFASFERVYRPEPLLVYGHRVAVSSLAYDAARDRLYILTSFEHEETDTNLGGFLFVLTLEELAQGAPLRLVRKPDGFPLQFGDKPEGIDVLDEFTLVVIHDDDRVTSQVDYAGSELRIRRKPHQASYHLVQLLQAEDHPPP